MSKLTYYYAERLDDADVYSIVGRTLKEVRAKLIDAYGEYGPIQKRVLEYNNAFDLFEWVSGEGTSRSAGYVVKEYKN